MVARSIENGGSRRKWLNLFGLLMPINVLLTLDRAALVLLAPMFMVEFQLTLVQTTLLTSAILWTYSIMQIPSGWAVSRFGVRLTMAVSLIVWSSALLVTPLAKGFVGLLALRILLGMGQAPDWAASMSTVKSLFNQTERARANSVLLSGMYLGTALGGPATAYLVMIGNWHLPFIVFGSVGIAVAIIWLIVFREPASTVETSGSEVGPTFKESMKLLTSSRQFWSVCCTSLFLNGIGSLLFILPLFLTEKTGLKLTDLAWITSAPAFTKYIAVLSAGVLADYVLKRTRSVWLARTPMIAAGGLIGGLSAIVAAVAPGMTSTVVFLCLCYLGIGLAQVAVWCCVQELTVKHTAVLTGCTNTFGNFGFATTPMIIALLVQNFGWTVAFCVYPVLGVCAFISAFMIRSDRPIEGPAQVPA